jgi:hypothetical protein
LAVVVKAPELVPEVVVSAASAVTLYVAVVLVVTSLRSVSGADGANVAVRAIPAIVITRELATAATDGLVIVAVVDTAPP